MNLKEKIFYDQENPEWLRTIVFIIIIWYIIDVVIFFLLGFLNILNVLAATNLLILLLLTNYIFMKFRAKQQNTRLKILYLPIVFVIALIEETIVYYSGGGLQGAAVSLWHDLALSIPVFLMIGVGILITNRIKKMNSGEIFLLGYICGAILEIILPVHFFNPILILLFGGAGAGFYSILYTAYAPIPEIAPESEIAPERNKIQSIKILLIGTIICFVCMVIAGIIGSTLYAMTSV